MLAETGFTNSKPFPVPNSVNAITPLIGKILGNGEELHEKDGMNEFYIFHIQSKPQGDYNQVIERKNSAAGFVFEALENDS